MSRFDRQSIIPGWEQARLADARVAVCGRDWTGTFTAWGLSSLGVGRIDWIGRPCEDPELLSRWLIGPPTPIDSIRVYEYPFDVEYGPELEWALQGDSLSALVCCLENAGQHARVVSLASTLGIPVLSGLASDGGWLGAPRFARDLVALQDPVASMAVAAMLIDEVDHKICPLPGDLEPESGSLGLRLPRVTRRPVPVVQIGAGGIGIYSALLLANSMHPLCVVDDDTVEESNLNRQGLFTRRDAEQGEFKAAALRRALRRLTANPRITHHSARLTDDSLDLLTGSGPAALLSAVDNAPTRLLLQRAGRQLRLPVIHGGTDVFAADCFVQLPEGPTLDEQMHGALSRAAEASAQRPRGPGCSAIPSYVAPGMMAAATMVARFALVQEGIAALPPVRWRAGCLPVIDRSRQMHSLSNEGLNRVVDSIRAENLRPAHNPPPAVASENPLLEVLQRDVAAWLPPELASRMAAAPHAHEVMDWLAAAAAFRYVRQGSLEEEVFLGRLSQGPRVAVLALAHALRSRMEPPPRSERWHRMDRLGLAVQLAAAAFLIAARAVVFHVVVCWPAAAAHGLADWSSRLPGACILQAAREGGQLSAWMSILAALWLCLEMAGGTVLLEKLRRWPARLAGETPPVAWRLDAFRAAWLLQGAFALALVLGDLGGRVLPSVPLPAWPWWLAAGAALGIGYAMCKEALKAKLGAGIRACCFRRRAIELRVRS